ncbi:proline-rich akt1 substrate 1 [Plakobranchus ocellatus]|uniref:Proline-rich akt1 substrate 1 n=1 Tax=Plakobranchus ocellatus TaxID=259542 RepID=A0AAV3Y113_9GAST|nr:proline-rich akt1 substrate 1 [Plakobranchus ocellatus]
MVVYTCHCLNVKIYADKPERDAQADALDDCPLGPACEAVELIDQGFQFAHKCLVQRMREGDWTIYVCVPCHMRTHGVNTEDRIVVVNADMNKGEDIIAAKQRSPDYSPVFKLLVKPSENRTVEDETIPRQSYETLQKQLGELQAKLSHYLKLEEEAMEMRIRKYEEEQRNNFLKLKKQIQHEKTALVSVLFQKSEANRSINDGERNMPRRHMTISHSKSAGEYERASPNAVQRNKPSRRIRDSSPDVFAMDGFDLDEDDVNEPVEFKPSAPRRSDNHSPSFLSGTKGQHQVHPSGRFNKRGDHGDLDTMEEMAGGWGDASVSRMSTSVPISMPQNARSLRHMAHHLDDEIEESAAEFDDIPRQMQALSESIQERDRYIFGDRPRQRVNTGDFTQVKWH